MEHIFLIVIGCDDPVSAKILTHDDGTNKTYTNINDAHEVVEEINSRHQAVVARTVIV